MFEFEPIINRLIQELKLKNKTDLSNLMGVSTQVMGNWKVRNKVPFEEIVTICLKENININKIISGKEETEKQNKTNFKEELHKMIDEIKEEKAEIYYHLIKAEILKEKL
jgi:hypothetical protein